MTAMPEVVTVNPAAVIVAAVIVTADLRKPRAWPKRVRADGCLAARERQGADVTNELG